MNYTKGEWRACVGYTFTMVKSAEPIAVIHSDNDEADAHLIAAAPDMYEALKGLLEGLGNPMRVPAFELVDIACLALAKAEGKLAPHR